MKCFSQKFGNSLVVSGLPTAQICLCTYQSTDKHCIIDSKQPLALSKVLWAQAPEHGHVRCRMNSPDVPSDTTHAALPFVVFTLFRGAALAVTREPCLLLELRALVAPTKASLHPEKRSSRNPCFSLAGIPGETHREKGSLFGPVCSDKVLSRA